MKGGEILNAIGMSFQQVLPTENFTRNSKGNIADIDSSVFQELLSTKQTGVELPSSTLGELYNIILGTAENSDISQEDGTIEDQAVLIDDMLSEEADAVKVSWNKLINELNTNEQLDYSQFTKLLVDTEIFNGAAIDISDEAALQQEFVQLLTQAELLLTNLSNEQDVIKAAPKILELLEKWVALENRNNGDINRHNGLKSSIDGESKEYSIWKDLVSSFQKRNQLVTNQQYNTNAKVTSKNIVKWLHNGINTQATLEHTLVPQPINVSNMPMSKLEQYVIHINQTQESQSVDKQLIDQFQNVMKTSRFLSMNNGVNQLSITLRPDNLGEMMVRLTEINGEMTLKIIVSSQATRQMLEANIHQLKSMFSPHQVVIEELEIDVQDVEKEHEEQPLDEHEEDHSQESSKEESKDFDGDFQKQFQELLMNEEV